MSLARRSSKPLLGLLKQSLRSNDALPALSAGASQLPSSGRISVSLAASPAPCATRGIASLSGGAFVLSRRLPAPDGQQQRSLSTSKPVLCNEFSDLDASPFGNPADEDDEVVAMTVGGGSSSGAAPVRSGILFGGSTAARAQQRTARAPAQKASWIGSVRHAGDYTQAALKKPVAEPTVWSQIIGACAEDGSGDTLKSTVSMLAAASKQGGLVPPLPAFNKLLALCARSADSMDAVHQLVEMMEASPALKPNDETHKQLEACFTYNNRERAS